MQTALAKSNRVHLFWLGLYVLIDVSWIRFDQFAYWHDPFSYGPVLAGVACAPEQYRTAMPRAAQWVAERLHLHSLTAGMVLLDLVSAVALSGMLYALLLRRLHPAAPQASTAAKALLGLLMGFYLQQTYAFARVETLPNCVFVAAALLLIGKIERGARRVSAACAVALIGLGFAEGCVRADVAVVLGVALALAALMGTLQASNRVTLAGTGLLVAGIAGAVLLYLMRIVYPAAHYCGKVFTLGQNVGLSYNRLGLLMVMPPVVVAIVVLLQRFGRRTVADRMILIAALLYLCVWSVLGNWSEPRIYIPFAIGLLPVACVALAHWATATEPAP